MADIAAVQQGNVSDHLLRGPAGRLYWVTPLTPQQLDLTGSVAYAVTPADIVGDDRLNRLDMWVLPDGDPRIANLNTLNNKGGVP